MWNEKSETLQAKAQQKFKEESKDFFNITNLVFSSFQISSSKIGLQ